MERYFKTAKHSLMIMLLCACLLFINMVIPINQFGIVPREMSHLLGIFSAPFLHGSWMHLMSNFFPFVIFSCLIGLQSLQRFWLTFILSIIFTGLLVWLLGRGGSVHIGMSGVVYALWGYLIVYGFKKRQFRDIIISIFVLLLYGGLVFGVLPRDPTISFESHLLGAVVGGALGYYLPKFVRETKPK